MPFAMIYGGMLNFNSRLFHIFRRDTCDQFEQQFGPRWVALNHRDDEAIEGLGAVGRIKLTIFDPRFAVAPLTMLGSVFIPLMLVVLVLSPC